MSQRRVEYPMFKIRFFGKPGIAVVLTEGGSETEADSVSLSTKDWLILHELVIHGSISRADMVNRFFPEETSGLKQALAAIHQIRGGDRALKSIMDGDAKSSCLRLNRLYVWSDVEALLPYLSERQPAILSTRKQLLAALMVLAQYRGAFLDGYSSSNRTSKEGYQGGTILYNYRTRYSEAHQFALRQFKEYLKDHIASFRAEEPGSTVPSGEGRNGDDRQISLTTPPVTQREPPSDLPTRGNAATSEQGTTSERAVAQRTGGAACAHADPCCTILAHHPGAHPCPANCLQTCRFSRRAMRPGYTRSREHPSRRRSME